MGVMFKEVMNFIMQLLVTYQVIIGVGILSVMFGPFAVYLYKVFTIPKEVIFFNGIEIYFVKLNPPF